MHLKPLISKFYLLSFYNTSKNRLKVDKRKQLNSPTAIHVA